MQTLLPGIEKVYRDAGCAGWGYSYLIRRAEASGGNIFLPRLARNATVKAEYPSIVAAGSIARIYITDHHFCGDGCRDASETFGSAPLYCSAVEYPLVAKRGLGDARTFEYVPHEIETGWEVVPTPGHTSGGVSYLWTNEGVRYLFTGDFLYNAGDRWVVGSRTLKKVQASLETIRGLEFDYLVGCGDEELGVPFMKLSNANKSAFLDEIITAF